MSQATRPLNFKEQALLIQQQHATQHLWLERIFDNPLWIVALGGVHFLMAFAVREGFTLLGTAHGIFTLILGLYFASNKRYPISYAVYVVAYIAGCEVMWRQNDFPLFWESGKYFTMVILGAAWLRNRRDLKMPSIAAGYIALLLPGVFFTISQEADIKALLSPNATGPLALFLTLLFFHGQRFTSTELRRAFILFAIPVVAIAGIVNYRVANLDIRWTGDSNNQAGDFGANQISTALGLAWLLLLTSLVVLMDKLPRRTLLLLGAICGGAVVWMIIQNFFTFSRGGLLGSLVAAGIMGVGLLFVPNKRALVAIAILVGIVFLIAVFPILDRTTQGNLSRRYLIETNGTIELSNRERIIEEELKLFFEFPVLGVGIGRGMDERNERYFFEVASHTEYSRLLAEHGLFGLGINFLFVLMMIQAIRHQTNIIGRVIAAGLMFWAFFYMFHSATRTVAPALVIGIASAELAIDYSIRKIVKEAPRLVPRIVPEAVLPSPAAGD